MLSLSVIAPFHNLTVERVYSEIGRGAIARGSTSTQKCHYRFTFFPGNKHVMCNGNDFRG